MIAAGRVYAVTLAAGLSRRYGADKLAQPTGSGSVLDAAMAPLDAFDWQGRAVVMHAERAANWQGIQAIVNDFPEQGMGHSLSLAAAAAQDAKAEFLLVMLGDMPCLTAESVSRLLEACPDRADALASLAAEKQPAGPPALFGCDWFRHLQDLEGDKGARTLLRDPANGLVRVDLPADQAIDIDTPEDLARLRSGC